MEGHDRHWHYFGGGFLVVGAALIGVRATLVAVATPPRPAFFNWYADLGIACFGLALLCGVAAASEWRFPVGGARAPLVRGRRIPKWRDRIEEMQPKQIAYLEALERERASAVKRGDRKNVREVNKQMKLARDAWWETEPVPDDPVPDPQAERRREFDRVAKLPLGRELRDIRSKIDRAKAARFYTRGFQFPGEQFAKYEALLSEHPGLYEKVERAYSAAHNVNQTLRWREAQQGDGARELLGVLPGDGLDVTHGAAGEALDALGERHNDPFVPDPEPAPALDPIVQRHNQIIIDQIGDDNERRTEVSRLIKHGFDLRGEVRNPTIKEMTGVARQLLNGALRSRLDRWCNDARGFIAANVYGVPSDLMAEDEEIRLLDEWNKDSVVAVLDAHISVLKRARDAISPTRLG